MEPPKMYIVRVDLVGGYPKSPSIHGPQVPPEDPSERPRLPGGVWGWIQDSILVRYLAARLDSARGVLYRYPGAYLSRYRQLVETHVPEARRESFGFYRDLPLRGDVVLSRSHGAAVFFTRDSSPRVSLRVIRDRIEHYVWPPTKERWDGPPTTFVSEPHETMVLTAAHRMRAGSGLTLLLDGALVYEGRMVLKGQNAVAAWSPWTARLDALLAFLRAAREQITDLAKLHRIEGAGRLEILGREIAEVERTGTHLHRPEEYAVLNDEYFRLAEAFGYHQQTARNLLEEIRRDLAKARKAGELVKEWAKTRLGDLIWNGLALSAPAVLGWILGHTAAGLGLGLLATIVVYLLVSRRAER